MAFSKCFLYERDKMCRAESGEFAGESSQCVSGVGVISKRESCLVLKSERDTLPLKLLNFHSYCLKKIPVPLWSVYLFIVPDLFLFIS